jgi:hypothetical protein
MSEEQYIVEKITGKRLRGSIIEYKVKWEGYTEEECTWEPYKNLRHLVDMIEEYDRLEAIKLRKKNMIKPEIKENPIQKNKSYKDEFETKESFDPEMIPAKVLTVKEMNYKLYALVEWSESSDGTIPESCLVPSELLTDTYPKVLIAFYETKIKFVKKK